MGNSPSSAGTQKHRVVDELRERILSGGLEPGDPLRQIPLSEDFGVAHSVIREALQVLEGLAARPCCRTASRADVEWLEEAAHRIHACRGKAKRGQRNELEQQFHQRFLELSGNETLLRQSAGYRFVGDLVVIDRDPDELLRVHLEIVEAVAANQPDKAERSARRHVAASAESIREHFSRTATS